MGVTTSGPLGYLGPRGTFSEEAALIYRAMENKGLQECASLAEIMEKVAEGRLVEGIVPLENSLEGGVAETLDLLASNVGVMIRREVLCPISHSLMAAPNNCPSEIKEVYSHPHALGQCRSYLAKNYPSAVCHPIESTAAAARLVVGKRGYAAIAPRRAAVIFGLEIIAEGIQDHQENITRFVVLARQDHPPTGHDKTSLVLAAPDGPGSLHRVLGFFVRFNINLTRIESRPARRSLGDWLFFIDCEGHRLEEKLSQLWLELAEAVPFLKLLGSYPQGGL